jgi:hypothetical protein
MLDKNVQPPHVGPSILSLMPRQLNATVGSAVQVDVSVAALAGPFDSMLTLSFNPEVLELVGVSEGELLASGPPGASFSVTPSATPGVVTLAIRQANLGTRERGGLAQLMFRAKSAGVATVTAQAPSATGSGGQFVSFANEPSVITVR